MPTTPIAPPEARQPSPLWHSLPAEHAAECLGCDPNNGLSETEVQRRLARFGRNRLPPPARRSALRRWFAQFNNVLIFVLLGAAAMTFFLGDLIDTAVIVAVVLLNAMIGYFQEGKAETALEAVQSLLSPAATVIRERRRLTVPAEELVPGDLVLLQSGDKVPADLRLIEVRSMRIDEAVLTGESVPVEKSVRPVATGAPVGDRTCLAYSGTLVTYGQGLGLVTATGSQTEIGKISTLLAEVGTLKSPLLQKIEQFARGLTAVILIAALATFLFGWLTARMELKDLFMAAVSLAVAAIPEGLPAIVTITLAIGVQRMARRQAILRKLPAVETLGSVTVICSDKTGTLTRNEMTVLAIATVEHSLGVSGAGLNPKGSFTRDGSDVFADDFPDLLELARAGLLCNDAHLREEAGEWRLVGDPTEGALITLALKAGLDVGYQRDALPRTDTIPFESEHRFMATLHRDHGGHGLIYLKGAPEVVLGRCHRQYRAGCDEPLDLAVWHSRIGVLAAQGQRLLALAVKPLHAPPASLVGADTDAGFTLLGIVGMIDPPRTEAINAVQRCQHAGIRVKMITGDHAATAAAIGSQLGIGTGKALTGAELETLTDSQLQTAVTVTDIFARASPEHKLRLVEALRAAGEVVAMTGDGVNDAPALKAADIGVAMGRRGTDAAKEAAEMVLANDNFATIAQAVEEGRTVYDNLRKTILFMMPTNGGQAGVIVGAILLGMALPITPLQILWVNLVTAVTLALTLAFEAAEGDLMQQPPRPPNEPLVTQYMLWRIGYTSVLLVVATLAMFQWELNQGVSIETARTAAVNTLVCGELVYLVNSRFFVASSVNLAAWIGNRYALMAMAALIAMQMAFTYAPFMQEGFSTRSLAFDAWVRVAATGLLIFLVVELEKAFARRRRSAAKSSTPLRDGSPRFAGPIVSLLALAVGVQSVLTLRHWYSVLTDGTPATAMGLTLAGLIGALAICLLLASLKPHARRSATVAPLALTASAALLAAAWHAPAYPFEPEQLPWLIAAAVGLLALAAIVLVVSLTSRQSDGSAR